MKKRSMRTVFIILSSALFFTSVAQQPPGTDIVLLDLTSRKKKPLAVSNPVNITNRAGYDNQPFFHPSLPLLYYASAYDQGRTDIMQFDLQQKITRPVTKTSEREYSPTVTPDRQFISCIIQRDNNAQDLGKYPLTGGEPVIIIDQLIVGYHAWLDADNLLLFVLGQPNTLRWYHISNKQDRIIRENIGRSLHKIPGEDAISFVDKSENDWMIRKVKRNGEIEFITPALPNREDLAWTPDGKILMSDGEKLFFWQPGKSKSWEPVTMPAGFSPRGITRLAISASGNKLAMVVSE